MSKSIPNPTNRKCNQCGSELIIIKSSTQKTERSFSEVTVTSYRCSNKDCQDEIDKRTAKRIELKNEQELARQKRLENAHLSHKAPIEAEKALA